MMLLCLHPCPATHLMHYIVIPFSMLFTSLCFLYMNLHFFYSHFRMRWHRQAFATSNKRSKSFSVNVFMPEVFRVCIITLLMSYLKRYIFCLNIYYSPSESLQDAERKCISWHKRQSSEVPYLHLQESHP